MTVADLVVERLRDAGVQTIFGVPGGGGNLDLIAAAGRAGLPFVLTATETAAAIAALAQAEVTGRPGACLTTLGPGVSSVVNGVACACLERAPVLVFTDLQPHEFEHQRLSHQTLMNSIVKWSGRFASDNARVTLTRALQFATEGRPGPVHLDCPAGVLGDVAGPDAPENESCGCRVIPRTAPDYDDRPEFERLVSAARKPLLIVGLSARRPEDAAAIRRLCARRRVPALVTYKAKGVVPDGHEWFAGVFTNGFVEQAVIAECDLIVGIGFDPVEALARPWRVAKPIALCHPWLLNCDDHIPITFQTAASVAEGVKVIERALSRSRWSARALRTLVDEQTRRVRVPGKGLTAQRVVEIAHACLGRAASRVTVDAGAHMIPATMLWPVDEPNGMLISNGLSTMGFALPAAIGASLLDRSRPTVALTGDGGLLMCAGELLTAAREQLPVITVVFNDASLSLIEIKQRARALPRAGVALGAVDWVQMAESMGVAAWRATDKRSLERAIGRARRRGGPALIDVKIDPSNYGATLRAVRG